MQRQQVKSSNIDSIGYDVRGRILEVMFVSGHVYQYLHVPETLFKQFMQAESKGTFFAANIRKTYDYRKVA